MAATSKTTIAGVVTIGCGVLAFITNAGGAVGVVKDFWRWLFPVAAEVPVATPDARATPPTGVAERDVRATPSPSPSPPARDPAAVTSAGTERPGPSPTPAEETTLAAVTAPPATRPPASWSLSPDDLRAGQVHASAALPGETNFKGRRGFRVLVTLDPASDEAPRFAFPMKGGRLGEFYRFISGSGQTSQGFGCEAWLATSGLNGAWAIEGDSLPAQDSWPTLPRRTRLNISYWCDGPVAAGDTVSFGFGLYLMDDAGRARMASWSGSDLPVRVQSVSLAPQ